MTPERATLDALARAAGSNVTDVRPVGGGCISPAWRVSCADGNVLFLKTAPPEAPAAMLRAEAESLELIHATRTVRVPRVRAVMEEWLALEWLEPVRATTQAWSELGAALARLHRTRAQRFGRESANCIGPLPQTNDWMADWPSFWREQRIVPQLRRASGQLGAATVARVERLLDRLAGKLGAGNEDGPSLLHGDLWSGNVHFTISGGALIDPSSYYGHREVDLAMAALFGGFPSAFSAAYSTEWPLLPGAAARRPIYQLYYLLVHVNLFGAAYVAQTRAALDAALS